MKDEILSQMPTVSFKDLEAAIKSIKMHYPGNDIENLQVSFEYLIVSFYPTIIDNIKSAMKDAYTQGYIQGLNDSKEKI